jgi:hypothetical protein
MSTVMYPVLKQLHAGCDHLQQPRELAEELLRFLMLKRLVANFGVEVSPPAIVLDLWDWALGKPEASVSSRCHAPSCMCMSGDYFIRTTIMRTLEYAGTCDTWCRWRGVCMLLLGDRFCTIAILGT